MVQTIAQLEEVSLQMQLFGIILCIILVLCRVKSEIYFQRLIGIKDTYMILNLPILPSSTEQPGGAYNSGGD